EMRSDEYFGSLMIQDIEIFGVDDFADSAVVIKARLKTRPIKQWEVGREYRRRLKQAFDDAGIEIPFPHRSIYFGEA
ncbi:MAG: mechanosensitive ion channel family protein, partial [Burkholderiales bacterium]|nr:mechanosensitive ion channel family protein [Burkholderiales bacterium]